MTAAPVAEQLLARYDALVCDLDGVVYAGPTAIPHAVSALTAAADGGRKVIYATNNASRGPQQVAEHLRGLGLRLKDEDVVNSAGAGAFLLARDLAPGARVLAVGGPGVPQALREAGLTPVEPGTGPVEDVEAVLQGYGADVRAADLAEAAYALAGGARWMATNTDLTLPTERGRAPGNGSLVAAVKSAVGITPGVAGKPMPTMYEMAALRSGVAATRVLAVGDRLETDVEGAVRAGMDSVLVMTGVHNLADAAAAPPVRRPTYVVADLRGLAEPYVVALEAPTSFEEPVSWPAARALLHETWNEVDGGALRPDDARARFDALAVPGT